MDTQGSSLQSKDWTANPAITGLPVLPLELHYQIQNQVIYLNSHLNCPASVLAAFVSLLIGKCNRTEPSLSSVLLFPYCDSKHVCCIYHLGGGLFIVNAVSLVWNRERCCDCLSNNSNSLYGTNTIRIDHNSVRFIAISPAVKNEAGTGTFQICAKWHLKQ